MSQSVPPAPFGGDLILYQTEDGRTRLQVRLQGETVWLTQAQLAELFEATSRILASTYKTCSKRKSCARNQL